MSTEEKDGTLAALPEWIRPKAASTPEPPEELVCQLAPAVSATVRGGKFGSASIYVWGSDTLIRDQLDEEKMTDLDAKKRVALPLLLTLIEEALPVLRAMVDDIAAKEKEPGRGYDCSR